MMGKNEFFLNFFNLNAVSIFMECKISAISPKFFTVFTILSNYIGFGFLFILVSYTLMRDWIQILR